MQSVTIPGISGHLQRNKQRYDDSMPGWQFQKNDRFYFTDFTNDGKDDLIVMKTADWSIEYLGMLRSTGNQLAYTKRYDDVLPGWQMNKNDKLLVVGRTYYPTLRCCVKIMNLWESIA